MGMDLIHLNTCVLTLCTGNIMNWRLSLVIVLLIGVLGFGDPVSGLSELSEIRNGPGTDIGYYEVRSDVEGAEVYFDNNLTGTISDGMLIVPVYTDGTLFKSYSVKKAGYSTWTEQILRMPKKGETIIFHAILKAKPVVTPGRINVASNPGAEVFVDSISKGVVPPSGAIIYDNIPSGSHVITLRLAGYKDYVSEVFVPAGDAVKVFVTLVPATTAAANGYASFTSVPSGAAVSVDGQNRGITPFVIPDMPPGNHVAVFSLTGFQDYNAQFLVTAGSTVQVSASLAPAPTQPQGTKTRAGGEMAVAGVIGVVFCGYLAARKR
jgi:hypothetical protein